VEVLVEEGVGARGAVHVVAGLRLRLRGDLGGQLEMRHRVDPDGAVVGLAEHLGLPPQFVVGGGDEVIPGEECQLALLGDGGRGAQSEPGGHPGRRTGRGAKEVTTVETAGSGLIHGGPP
jgi:hypothetical protein